MLGRLINALDSSWAHIFIHVDKKADLKTFLPHIPAQQNVHLLERRIKVFWGGYSQVQATLNLMEEAVESGIDFKYAVLLSGSHYPIKSNSYIYEKFRNSKLEYLQFAKTRDVGSEFKTSTYSLYDHAIFNPRTVFFENKLLNKFARIPGFLVGIFFTKVLPKLYKRRMVRNIIPYTGANWWTITKPCMDYVLNYLDSNKDYVKYFRFCIQPDETFFHTIICNSNFRLENSDVTLRSLMGNGVEYGKFSKLRGLSLTFTKCSSKGSPKTFSEIDIADISKELNYFGYPQLFARKFDPKISCKLLNIIDKEVLSQTNPSYSQS